jgi:hypothetical protein
MEEILEVAKELLDLNSNASLTGTLMLKLRVSIWGASRTI